MKYDGTIPVCLGLLMLSVLLFWAWWPLGFAFDAIILIVVGLYYDLERG